MDAAILEQAVSLHDLIFYFSLFVALMMGFSRGMSG
jgi:hypothetical protein